MTVILLTLWALVLAAPPTPVADAATEPVGDEAALPAEVVEPASVNEARKAIEGGDAQVAVETLTAILKDAPDHRASRLLLGHAYLSLKKFQHALNEFSRVVLKDANVPEANWGRALALRGLGDVPKAIIWAKKATEVAPDDRKSWEVLGDIYLTKNYLDAPRAEATFRQLLVLDPNHRLAQLQLARALSYQQKIEAAIELLEKLAADTPEDWPVQTKLAESYYAVRKLSKAEALLERVLAAQPDNAEAIKLLDAVRGRKAYQYWIPLAALLAIPLLFLMFRRLRRGKVVKE